MRSISQVINKDIQNINQKFPTFLSKTSRDPKKQLQ